MPRAPCGLSLCWSPAFLGRFLLTLRAILSGKTVRHARPPVPVFAAASVELFTVAVKVAIRVLDSLQVGSGHHDGACESVMNDARAGSVVCFGRWSGCAATAVDETECLIPLGRTSLASLDVDE